VLDNSQKLPSLATASLRDPKEGTAFAVLAFTAMIGVTLFLTLFWRFLPLLLVIFIGTQIRKALARAHYRANAVQVTANQFPEIHRMAAAFAERLGYPLPTIYVIQDSIYNAFAMRLLGQPVVVLHSMAVDSILIRGDFRQLAYLVGHELGHHYAGHLGWRQVVAEWGAWMIWIYLWWSRRCEFTCDRYGLACSENLESAQLAICNMAVGGQMASRVNIPEAVQQWEAHRTEFFVRYYALYSTHPHTLHRLAALSKAADELGVPARTN
jgi:Zn-dependent protease with chaperone function